MPLDGLLPEAYSSLVDLTQAAAACSSMVVSSACTDSCRAFLAKASAPIRQLCLARYGQQA